jgi:hypothetical protein
MNAIVSKRGRNVVAVMLLSFAIVLVALAAPAGAAVYRATGGSASSQVGCIPGGKISVRSWVTKDNGGPQDVGVSVSLYDNTTKRWTDFAWETDVTGDPYGSNGATAIFGRTITAPRGSHYVRVWYGWRMTTGWQYRSEDFGWCNF